jgi:hypothetical protein
MANWLVSEVSIVTAVVLTSSGING